MKYPVWAYVLIVLIAVIGALFIGKTTISEQSFTVERPFTAILFLLTIIAGLVEVSK